MTREPKPAPPGRLKMGEVARRAGVNRGTVQHYMREGLLPRPRKTHRNMAWYDDAFVDRIRVIRTLQQRDRRSLSEIRRLLHAASGDPSAALALARAERAARAAAEGEGKKEPRLSVDEAARAFKTSPKRVRALAARGLLSLDGDLLSGADVDVLAAVAELDRSGFTAAAGFPLELFRLYEETVAGLVEREIAAFLRIFQRRRTAGAPAAETEALARDAIHAGEALLTALRRRMIREALHTPELALGDRRATSGRAARHPSLSSTRKSPRSAPP